MTIKSRLRKLGFFPVKWVAGLSRHGGYSLVCCRTGRVLGEAYQLAGPEWWAILECSPIGAYLDADAAKGAVEAKAH